MMRNRWMLIVLLGLTAGCVWSDRRPMLVYSPVDTGDNRNNIVIKVQALNDIRPQKETGGPSKNADGMNCEKIIPQNSIADWVTEALKAQLGASGYTVVEGPSDSPNVITGDVYEVCGKVHEASIGIKMVLQQDGKVLLDKKYYVKRDGDMTFVDASLTYANTLSVTLKAALLEIVYDLQAVLKK